MVARSSDKAGQFCAYLRTYGRGECLLGTFDQQLVVGEVICPRGPGSGSGTDASRSRLTTGSVSGSTFRTCDAPTDFRSVESYAAHAREDFFPHRIPLHRFQLVKCT